ncbi:MAG: hypothetical protein LAO21_17985 [Acidobacteriia bacterium]|nr:hypothetical protein [Terriglobia bacterium]
MQTLNPFTLVPALLALQFAVFGWRIARELSVEEQGGRTWLLISDFVNLTFMLAVLFACVVLPLQSGTFGVISRTVLGVGYVFICFTPLMIAGHYCLYSREGRAKYDRTGRGVPWLTGQELILFVFALVAAAVVAFVIVRG